jgi:hypothetical protein
MNCNRMFSNSLSVLIFSTFLFFSPNLLLSENNVQHENCLDRAIEKIMEIRSLPARKYLRTLDGQKIMLNEFYCKCLSLSPQCCLFEKFYYWQSEIRQIVSQTKNGTIKHKIRCYHNCLSIFCSNSCDPRKTHGDVSEFYDEKGEFMGIAVYMGNGNYCSLPFSGYKK